METRSNLRSEFYRYHFFMFVKVGGELRRLKEKELEKIRLMMTVSPDNLLHHPYLVDQKKNFSIYNLKHKTESLIAHCHFAPHI